MNFRLRIAAWFGVALIAMTGLLIFTAHHHLDQELRKEKWDRSHPKFPDWSLHGSFSDEEIHDILGELMQAWAWVGLPALVLALGVGLLLANRSIAPIRKINRALAEKTPAALRTGIPVPANDAVLVELVSQINALLQRMGEAYEEMSAFSSRVAHELRTPLALLRLRIEQSAAAMPPELSECLQDELARLTKFVDRSLLAARAEAGRLGAVYSDVDLSGLLEDLREPYEVLFAGEGVSVSWDAPPGVRVRSEPDLLRQILHNLLGNASRYAATRFRLRLRHRHGLACLTLANDVAASPRSTAGLGIGIRLVNVLSKSLEGHAFRLRKNARVFAVRLTWRPSNTLPYEAGS